MLSSGLLQPALFWLLPFTASLPPSSLCLPSFNLLSFAGDLQLWRDTLVETTDAACHEAMQWVTRLGAQGGTSILQALLASPPPEPNPSSRPEIPSPPLRTQPEAFQLQRAV